MLPVKRAARDKLGRTAVHRQQHAVPAPFGTGFQRHFLRLADFHGRQNLDRFPDGVRTHGYHASRQVKYAPTLADITIVQEDRCVTLTMTAHSGPQLVASAVSPLAIVLAGADPYFADNQAQQIWQVRSYATRPAPALFAADMSISSPAALQLSSDGARLYVANAGSRKLGVYDVAARIAGAEPLFELHSHEAGSFRRRFRLSAKHRQSGTAPLCVLSDKLDRRAVYFVPGAGGVSPPRPFHYKPQ